MNNSFTRFQERNKKHKEAVDKKNASFVFQGLNSTTITSGDKSLTAAVVNLQEQDQGYIYTLLDDALNIGEIWEAKTLHFLISEEIITIKDVNYHKYLAELCNVQVGDNWGYFSTSNKNDIDLKQSTILVSLQKPYIVLPDGTLNVGDKILLSGRPWLVKEYDNISHPGICYYSLEATTVGKYETGGTGIIEEKEDYQEEEITHLQYKYNEPITVSTVEGYFKSNESRINIISHTATSVVFSVPYGIPSVTITTKYSAGEYFNTITYSVKE